MEWLKDELIRENYESSIDAAEYYRYERTFNELEHFNIIVPLYDIWQLEEDFRLGTISAELPCYNYFRENNIFLSALRVDMDAYCQLTLRNVPKTVSLPLGVVFITTRPHTSLSQQIRVWVELSSDVASLFQQGHYKNGLAPQRVTR